MAAPLTIWIGRSGSGKSTRLYDRLCAHAQKGEPAILIVAEQYTFEAEKALCSRLGGLLGIQVLSFSRLCERVLQEQGNALPVIGGPGRRMILKKAALDRRQELKLFARVAESRGFVQRMDDIITRCKQSGATPEDLKRTAETLPEGSQLRGKMEDIALLYGESEAFLRDRYLTESDLWDRAGEALPGSFLTGIDLYVDGIDIPSRQMFRLIGRLLHVCRTVTVSLRADPDGRDTDLFGPDIRTWHKLQQTAEEAGSLFFREDCRRDKRRTAELKHLEKHLFAQEENVFPDPAPAIVLWSSSDREEEAERCAQEVLDLVRQGYRYRDVAVMVTDAGGYVSRVRRAFARKGIPLFYDATRPVTGHSAMDMVLCAVRFVQSGAMEDALHILKSGYVPCTVGEGEIFENYILRYGLYGSSLSKPFDFGEVPEEAERVRAVLYPPLAHLREGLGRGTTGEEKARAVYAYMVETGLKEKLQAQGEAWIADGRPNAGELFSQVYSTLSGLLSDIAAIWGKDKLSQKAFLALLEEGAMSSAMGVLPGTADQVILGDFVRTRTPAVQVLFVLGCNEGLLPPVRTDDELISDGELELLKEQGLELWNGVQALTEMERLELYTAFNKAQQKLYFSCSFSADGEELSAAPLLGRVRRLFPQAQVLDARGTATYPTDREGGFRRLVRELSLYEREGVTSDQLSAQRAYFAADAAYGPRLRRAETAITGGISPAPFGKALAERMYGPAPSMSASRLEQFNRCPFAHYVKYGIKAKERPESKEEAADAGTFLHDALDGFLKLVKERGLNWANLTDEDADALVDEVMPALVVSHNDGIFVRDVRLREALFLRIESVKKCARSIAKQMQVGSYRPYETELAFGPDCPFPPLLLKTDDGRVVKLYGRIDRVDRSRDGFYRVIDYKMGDRKFEPGKIEAGLSLQLPLYLAAVKGLDGAMGGMYYMPLSLPAAKEGEEQRHVLRGVTAGSEEAVVALERHLEGTSQIVQGLRRNKDGKLSGNVCREEDMGVLTQEAVAVAERTLDHMRRGEAQVTPYKGACKWCPYQSVCRFDRQQKGCYERDAKKMTIAELLQSTEDRL
jgi:ATP-dependent helicase/nuclease subunit B